ncbi:hypothetical protein ACJRO7_028679 [Eucalyptus globulus]|uniref:Uncharacterized protein n=1 Tax=Eucalyptus globulus TaxID=34317 RepID=A0ABD3JVA9_EUCGL
MEPYPNSNSKFPIHRIPYTLRIFIKQLARETEISKGTTKWSSVKRKEIQNPHFDELAGTRARDRDQWSSQFARTPAQARARAEAPRKRPPPPPPQRGFGAASC